MNNESEKYSNIEISMENHEYLKDKRIQFQGIIDDFNINKKDYKITIKSISNPSESKCSSYISKIEYKNKKDQMEKIDNKEI